MNSKKKIIVFIDWYVPGYKSGGPVRSMINMVDNLKDKHDFLIVTRDTDYCDTEKYPNITSNVWNDFEEGVRIFYASKNWISINNIQNILKEARFDILYINGIFSFYFSILPLVLSRKLNKKRIVASKGMFAPEALKIKKVKKQVYLFFANFLNIFDNVIFHVSNHVEKMQVSFNIKQFSDIIVASNFPRKLALESGLDSIKSKKKGNLKLVSIARVAPEKNLLFALEIIKNSLIVDTLEFDIYGTIYDQDYWGLCEKIISVLPSNIKVEYKGVADSNNLAAIFKQYHALFLPTKGENFGHIIIEALMCACPVIISNKTPWQDLTSNNAGWNISLDDKDKYVEILKYGIDMNEDQYNDYRIGALNFAKAYLNKTSTLDDYLNLLN